MAARCLPANDLKDRLSVQRSDSVNANEDEPMEIQQMIADATNHFMQSRHFSAEWIAGDTLTIRKYLCTVRG